MEHAGDSDAYSYLTAKKRECMREEDAKALVADTLCALQYMHDLVSRATCICCAMGVWVLILECTHTVDLVLGSLVSGSSYSGCMHRC